MSDHPPGKNNPHRPGRYEMRIQGQIPAERQDWFEGMEVIKGSDDLTILRGEIVDQSALHGLLNKIRDLNILLISVNHISDLE